MRDIQKLVRSLGIGGNYQGYRYLLYALSLCLQNEDYLLSVSKLLYPEIAHTYQTSASSVERNLRTVVSVCWERGNRPLLESISLCPLSSKPTIGEFLDILTEYLKDSAKKLIASNSMYLFFVALTDCIYAIFFILLRGF